jgi:hypothetical protein
MFRYLYWPNVSVSFSSDSLIDNHFLGFTVPIFGLAYSNRLTFFCCDKKIGRLKNRNLKQAEKQSANTKIGTWNQPIVSVGTIRRLNLYRKIDQSDLSPTTPITSYTYSPKKDREKSSGPSKTLNNWSRWQRLSFSSDKAQPFNRTTATLCKTWSSGKEGQQNILSCFGKLTCGEKWQRKGAQGMLGGNITERGSEDWGGNNKLEIRLLLFDL